MYLCMLLMLPNIAERNESGYFVRSGLALIRLGTN